VISLKTTDELAIMDRCNAIVLAVLSELGEMICPGLDIADLDAYAEERTRGEGAVPSFKGYHGFPATLCVSVNEEVVHGIPRSRTLQEGDIASIDFGVFLEQFHGDGAQTYPVGTVAPDVANLLAGTREAMRLGIEQIRPGNRLGDVGHAVQSHAEANGWGVVREFVGHGIGRRLHESPQLPNYGEPGRGQRLEEGMVLAIEPMLNLGVADVRVGADNWTVATADGKPSAHFERSVAVTADGPWVLGTGCPAGVVDVKLPRAQEPARVASAAGQKGQS
jgi:methionyl aminopeptidase